MGDISDDGELLRLLFPLLDAEHRVELRVLRERRLVARAFCEDVDEALRIAAANAGTGDVYFGVAARGPADDGTGRNAAYAAALWADVDAKCYPDRAAALAAILGTEPRASAVVASGHGWHPYWLLEEPVRLDGDPASVDGIEGVMRGIRARLRAPGGPALDACDDAARVLRVPGTVNHKPPAPTPVRLVELRADRRYDLGALRHLYLPRPARAAPAVFGGEERDGGEALARATAGGLPARMRDLVVSGELGGYPSRSERDQAVIVALLGSGLDADDLRAIFEEFPVGEKYREPGEGDRYLALSIAEARRFIGSQPKGRRFGALPPEERARVAVKRACRELGRISRALPGTRLGLQRRLGSSRATTEKYLAAGVRLGWYRRRGSDATGPGRPAAVFELVDGVRPRGPVGLPDPRDAAQVAGWWREARSRPRPAQT